MSDKKKAQPFLFQELNIETTKSLLSSIQAQIQQRDEEMAWLDSCCLQLKRRDDTLTFQMESPAAKQDWITGKKIHQVFKICSVNIESLLNFILNSLSELRLAQLALDANNSPAWEVPEQERRPSTKMPLFVRSRPVVRSHHHTEVGNTLFTRRGVYYFF